MGNSTAARPRPATGPTRVLPGPVQGSGGPRRCRSISAVPRNLSGVLLGLLVLWLCFGCAVAGGDGAVAAQQHGGTKGLLTVGAAMFAAHLASSPGTSSRRPAAPTFPHGVVQQLPMEMEGDTVLPVLPQYRAAIDLDSFVARTSLAAGKEESKLGAAAAVQAVRVLLRRVVPDVDDMDLVDRIAQAQVKAYILQQHFETFPVECARGRGKGGKKQKRGAAGAAARANKANSSHRSDPTTPRPAPNTRTRCMVDHLLDGGSAQGFDVQGIGQKNSTQAAPNTSKRPRRSAATTVDYCHTRTYAGKDALWEDLTSAGKAKRLTEIVNQLQDYAADESAFDEMVSRIVCHPRLTGFTVAQSKKESVNAKLKSQICDRVKAALQELKRSKVTSTKDGYQVFMSCARSFSYCVVADCVVADRCTQDYYMR